MIVLAAIPQSAHLCHGNVLFLIYLGEISILIFLLCFVIGSRHGLIVLGMDKNNKGIITLELGTKNSRSKEGRQEKNG